MARWILPVQLPAVFWLALAGPQTGFGQNPPAETWELQLVRQGGLYPKWCQANNLIVFNELRPGKAFTEKISGTYEIFIMKPDGTGVACLTEKAPAELAKFHKCQPYWHPSGKYIIFTAQNEHTKPTEYNMDTFPGIGHNHDVWIMSSDGQQYWRLTNNPDNLGVIRPSFSHDGRMVYWNEEYSMEAHPGVGSPWKKERNPKGEEWGLWRIKLAEVAFDPIGPRLANIRVVPINELHSGLRLIEGSGFSRDDQSLIWEAANTNETEGQMWWGDVYVSDLKGGALQRLTKTAPLHQGNENMEYSPDGKSIAWSYHDNPEPGKKVEIWLMRSDGSGAIQLTFFNKPGHPHRKRYQPVQFTNACLEMDWGPDGRTIVFSISNGAKLEWPYLTPNIYLLTMSAKK
jgi:Tol biopolymer transport system component